MTSIFMVVHVKEGNILRPT